MQCLQSWIAKLFVISDAMGVGTVARCTRIPVWCSTAVGILVPLEEFRQYWGMMGINTASLWHDGNSLVIGHYWAIPCDGAYGIPTIHSQISQLPRTAPLFGSEIRGPFYAFVERWRTAPLFGSEIRGPFYAFVERWHLDIPCGLPAYSIFLLVILID